MTIPHFRAARRHQRAAGRIVRDLHCEIDPTPRQWTSGTTPSHGSSPTMDESEDYSSPREPGLRSGIGIYRSPCRARAAPSAEKKLREARFFLNHMIEQEPILPQVVDDGAQLSNQGIGHCVALLRGWRAGSSSAKPRR